jgi:hypothetical protein
MPLEFGEVRDAMGLATCREAEKIAEKMQHIREPFYLVFSAKQDCQNPTALRRGWKMYYDKPPKILGVLVWHIDNRKGLFEFVPELSFPYDIPLDPRLLSTKEEDFSARVACQGEKARVLLS